MRDQPDYGAMQARTVQVHEQQDITERRHGERTLLGTSIVHSPMPLVRVSRNHERSVAYNGHTFFASTWTNSHTETNKPRPRSHTGISMEGGPVLKGGPYSGYQ